MCAWKVACVGEGGKVFFYVNLSASPAVLL